jgi:hypothetical protein
MSQIGYIKECNCPADFRHLNGAGVEVDCVALDHYIKSDPYCAPEPGGGMVLPLIEAFALYDSLASVRYGSEKPVVSVTMLTKCPLTVYYETHVDWVGRLMDNAFMVRGTFGHEGMLRNMKGRPGWVVEESRHVVLDTTIGEVRLYGTPDAVQLLPGRTILYDLKTQQEWAIAKKLKAKDAELYADLWIRENLIQVNVYAAMLARDGIPVNEAELHYLDGKWKDPKNGKSRIRVLPVKLDDPERVLAWAAPKAGLLQSILDRTIPVESIPKKEWKGWKPSSGVQYLVDGAT